MTMGHSIRLSIGKSTNLSNDGLATVNGAGSSRRYALTEGGYTKGQAVPKRPARARTTVYDRRLGVRPEPFFPGPSFGHLQSLPPNEEEQVFSGAKA